MRALVVAFAAALLGWAPVEPSDVAVSLAAQPVANSCAVTATATIVAYDTARVRDVAYRFVHSDGTATKVAHLGFGGSSGAVAQSVSDTWRPRGGAPWVGLEITAPGHLRSRNVPAASRCPRGLVADR